MALDVNILFFKYFIFQIFKQYHTLRSLSAQALAPVHPFASTSSVMSTREKERREDGSLPNRAAFHPARKIFHFGTGICFALANENLSRTTCVVLTTVLLVTVVAVEAVRIRAPSGRVNRFVIRTFKPFLRAHETRALAGMLYYVFGVCMTVTLFPRSSASLGIIALACLDPMAAFGGTLFTPHLPALRLSHGKSLAGLVTAASAASLVLYTVIRHADVATSSLKDNDAAMLAILIAWAGALTEFAIPSPQVIVGTPAFPLGIDDNAIIPIVSAAVAKVVLRTTQHRLELIPSLI